MKRSVTESQIIVIKINMGWYRTERENAVVTCGILNRSAIAGLVPPVEWQPV